MFKPKGILRTLRQKQLPSFEIWLTFDDISVPTFQGVAVLAMLSLTHFGRSKPVRADQLGWNLASIGKEEGKNEPASLFELDFILNLSESMGKAQLTFSKIRSVACNMLTCWHPAVKTKRRLLPLQQLRAKQRKFPLAPDNTTTPNNLQHSSSTEKVPFQSP